MNALGTLFEALQAEADGLDLIRRCANGCGATLPATVANAYAMCDRCALLTSKRLHDCRGCGREWTAKQEAHCAECHCHFSSDSAFDAHTTIDHGPCGDDHKVCVARSVHRDPATLIKRDGTPRLISVETPHGPTWTWPGTRPADLNRSTS